MSSINLLYPELLSTETLLQVLLERRVKVERLENMTRERLIEIFTQYCLPYGQRKCRRAMQENAIKSSESIVGNLNERSTDFNKNINNKKESDQTECDLHLRKKPKLDETNSDCVDVNGAVNNCKRKTSYSLETIEDVPPKKQKCTLDVLR
ncbi:uncharacterized protein LOC143917306 [Arctopsyche grandis]|uniref:uncharacterized protein LOC143917306 n=1 Tax=Arctopsyche grandis TaxID=121162 RepID=UPI00406D6F4F